MLDIKFIRENKDLIKNNCLNRRVKIDIDELLKLDDERKEILQSVEKLRAERKQTSKGGKPSEDEIKKMRAVGDSIKQQEDALEKITEKYQEILLKIPNLTHPQTPVGDEKDFKVLEEGGKIPQFKFSPRDHEEIMTKLDLLDFEKGAKVASSKFYFSKGKAVKLNQALINYGLDKAEKYGYELLETPDMAKDEIIFGAGYSPRGEETQIYSVENSDLSLIGTAEITVAGYHAGEVLDLSKGPKKYAALSHCFRTEAGAYGRESKGLYRVHQFTKLEFFIFCEPKDSEKYHAEMLKAEKEIVAGLKVPYRIIDIASGDLGGPAYRKFDIEAWTVMKATEKGQGDYGEITSCSNCTDYQARRLNIKYRQVDGKTDFVHTLNGTAIVTSRFPLVIVENYQQKDGGISIPKVLQKYTGFKKI